MCGKTEDHQTSEGVKKILTLVALGEANVTNMDDFKFEIHLKACRTRLEKIHHLTINNYSDPSLNTIQYEPLEATDFENFLHQREGFMPRELPEEVRLLGSLRLMYGTDEEGFRILSTDQCIANANLSVQVDLQDKDTFAPQVVSLSKSNYEAMVRTMCLPFRGIESTAVVGPFFWSSYDSTQSHLQLIYRKSDVRRAGRTHGWELMLSHDAHSALTCGYVKGTKNSDGELALRDLVAAARHIAHPLLLPVLILSVDLQGADQIQRSTRAWLRDVEMAIHFKESDKEVDFMQVRKALTECHSQVLWKPPQAYKGVIEDIERAMERFMKRLPEGKVEDDELGQIHRSMLAQLEFETAKLRGMEHYVARSLARLDIQRSAVNLDMAWQQRQLADAAKRESVSMKTLSLLGAVFLPSTYIASLFSTTFFDFLPDRNKDGGANDTSGAHERPSGDDSGSPQVSPMLWLFFVVTVPLTLLIVLGWMWWDRRQERKRPRVHGMVHRAGMVEG